MSARRFLAAGTLMVVLGGCNENAKAPNDGGPAATVAPKGTLAADAPLAAELCEHGVPSDLCTRCTPELAEVFKEQGDWCAEHGVPESHCRQCNPKLDFNAPAAADAAAGWCREHAIEESKCTQCHPELIAKFIEAGDWCAEHGFPESACPYCHPELPEAVGLPRPVFPPPGTMVRLASAELEEKAGIEVRRAEATPLTDSLQVVGRLEFNQNRLAQLSARGEAVIQQVQVDLGDAVKAGQPLVWLASAGVGEVQGQLTAATAKLEVARAALAREQTLVDRGISAKKDLEEARGNVAAAEGEYQAALAALAAAGADRGSEGGRYALRSPFAGVVVTRDAVAGRSVSSGQVLVEVADLTTLWAVLDVPEEHAAAVKPGQKVVLQLEGENVPDVEATVSRVAASVDPTTRTVRVRVDVPNPDGSLRAGTFLRARIATRVEHGALLVPREALQEAQGQRLVFVRKGPGVYEPVPVEAGSSTGAMVRVRGRLSVDAQVVTAGAFMLKTEILKDSIGAGCADD